MSLPWKFSNESVQFALKSKVPVPRNWHFYCSGDGDVPRPSFVRLWSPRCLIHIHVVPQLNNWRCEISYIFLTKHVFWLHVLWLSTGAVELAVCQLTVHRHYDSPYDSTNNWKSCKRRIVEVIILFNVPSHNVKRSTIDVYMISSCAQVQFISSHYISLHSIFFYTIDVLLTFM